MAIWSKETGEVLVKNSKEDFEVLAIKPWTRPDSWFGKTWYGWFVGLGRTRDSGVLTRSNFDVFLEALRELPEVVVDDGDDPERDTVFVVLESHWACGWIEWIAIHPDNIAALKLADEMMCALEDYPVLDECHYSEMECTETVDYWAGEPLRERVRCCKDCGESVFAARRDYPTEKVFDYLRDQL